LLAVLEYYPTFLDQGGEFEINGSTSFDLQIDGVRQGNRNYASFGPLSGTLTPGSFVFTGITTLEDGVDENGLLNGMNDVAASGFTRLKLASLHTPAVPEASGIIVWSVLAAIVVGYAGYKNRNRAQATRRRATRGRGVDQAKRRCRRLRGTSLARAFRLVFSWPWRMNAAATTLARTLTFVVAIEVPSEAFSSIAMSIDGGVARVRANDGVGAQHLIDDLPSFDLNGTSRAAVDGVATASAIYYWTNASGVAVLETVQSLAVSPDASSVSNTQQIVFTLHEPAFFSIDGRFSGTMELAGEYASIHTSLRSLVDGYVRQEVEQSNDEDFDLLIDGVRQGNDSFISYGTEGLIGPGMYEFLADLSLTNVDDAQNLVNSMTAEGFTQLRLTAAAANAAPELASASVWLLLGLAVAGLAWRRREHQPAGSYRR
jgi:hypothetical protein